RTASPSSAGPCPTAPSWSPRAASATTPTCGRRPTPAPTPCSPSRPWCAPLPRPPPSATCSPSPPELEEPMTEPRKILLGEDKLPSAWFNIVPSMPTKPDPYLHPQTRQPVGPDDPAPLFSL